MNIYLINIVGTNIYKIGVSKDPKVRCASIQVDYPKLDLVLTAPCYDAYKVEHKLHKIFVQKHNEGEWFNLTDNDLYILNELYKQEYISEQSFKQWKHKYVPEKDPYIDSRDIAEMFGKKHKHVLRSIYVLIEDTKDLSIYRFEQKSYEYNHRELPYYLMNKNAVMLLVLGFTGRKNIEEKTKFVTKLNKIFL